MKSKERKNIWSQRMLFVMLIMVMAGPSVFAQKGKKKQLKNQHVISYVDTSLDGSQKYVLRVDGKPFYMTNVQVRMDLMRHSEKWPAKAREEMIAALASDGFNTVSIPVHWYEVEPEKDRFDWTILDEYLSLMNKYNMKMEMLWFGTNSGGHVQWLSRSKTEPVHLRTPDYVLYAPSYGAPNWSDRKVEGFSETASEFTIRETPYSMDLEDNRLRDRETYVLGAVMAHIAEWDKNNGTKHPLIGVQIGNEVTGMHKPYSNETVNSYLSHVASAVKNSDYVVWTRTNCVFWEIYPRVFENERLRNTPEGTNIDFVGIDTYSHHFPSSESFITSMRSNVPYDGKNYRMIMETNSERPYSAQMHLAALSGNNAFNYYDASGLYIREGNGVKVNAAHIEDVRLVNKILRSAPTDIALNANGYGLFVHNWKGTDSDLSVSNEGIGFTPSYPTSQGISIIRSKNEILLMSTKGGAFTIPAGIKITEATYGRFNDENQWDVEGKMDFNTSENRQPIVLEIGKGTTIRLVCDNTGKIDAKTYQAEFADACVAGKILSEDEGIGFAGNGYVKFPSVRGAYVQFNHVDGQSGRERTIRIRYSYGGDKEPKLIIRVNGEQSIVRLKPTGSYNNYQYATLKVNLKSGTNNEVRVESDSNVTRINRAAYYLSDCHIDEMQVY